MRIFSHLPDQAIWFYQPVLKSFPLLGLHTVRSFTDILKAYRKAQIALKWVETWNYDEFYDDTTPEFTCSRSASCPGC